MPNASFYSNLANGERNPDDFFAPLPDAKFEELLAAYAVCTKKLGDRNFRLPPQKAADELIWQIVEVVNLQGASDIQDATSNETTAQMLIDEGKPEFSICEFTIAGLPGDGNAVPPGKCFDILLAAYKDVYDKAFAKKHPGQPIPALPKTLGAVFEPETAPNL